LTPGVDISPVVRILSVVSGSRVYILSPAHCGGLRAQLIKNDSARFELAKRLRTPAGATIGEVFAFLSGLYFRGKLAYAKTFARPPRRANVSGALVITTNRGLVAADTSITIDDIRTMGNGDIDPRNRSYRLPLRRDAERLGAALGPRGRAILLGSVASGKYVDILLEIFGDRLLFPREFVGRGDMSRGGLMLRCVDAGQSLTYVPVRGAVRHGARPAKLGPRHSAIAPTTDHARRSRSPASAGRKR
jgi:hypothetical protein